MEHSIVEYYERFYTSKPHKLDLLLSNEQPEFKSLIYKCSHERKPTYYVLRLKVISRDTLGLLEYMGCNDVQAWRLAAPVGVSNVEYFFTEHTCNDVPSDKYYWLRDSLYVYEERTTIYNEAAMVCYQHEGEFFNQ